MICPHCKSTNIEIRPLRDEDNVNTTKNTEELENIYVFVCLDCNYVYIGPDT